MHFHSFFLCWEYLKLLHSCALSLNYTEKFGRLRKATRTYGQTWLNYVKPLNLLEIPGTQAQQGVYPCLVALPWCFPHGRLLRLLRSLLQTWRWSASRRPQRKELGLKRVKRKRIHMNFLDPPDSESRWNILQWHIQHVIRSTTCDWITIAILNSARFFGRSGTYNLPAFGDRGLVKKLAQKSGTDTVIFVYRGAKHLTGMHLST